MFLFALSIHECAHAWMADRCGDPTARYAGRITLNPLAHLDLMGTLCILFAPIGWGKPVPVNPYNLRNPRRDDILVSAAGPVSNFLMAFVCGIVFRVLVLASGGVLPAKEANFALWFLASLSLKGVLVACGLGVFNLVPLFPLDGSHILKGLLPTDLAVKYESLNPLMPVVLLILIFTGQLLYVVLPPIYFLVSLFTGLHI